MQNSNATSYFLLTYRLSALQASLNIRSRRHYRQVLRMWNKKGVNENMSVSCQILCIDKS